MRATARGRLVLTAAALVLATTAGATAHRWNPIARELDKRTGQAPAQVWEDQQGWDCRTMGNRDCGVIDTSTCGPIGNPDGCSLFYGARRKLR